jgi:UDP-2,3-diacylglucosamine pyrophosphatase LpxH
MENLKDENLIARHCGLDGKEYRLVICGHFHHHRIIEQGIDKFFVIFGSLKGADDYGHKAKKVSSTSQGVVIIDGDGEIDVRRIKLT